MFDLMTALKLVIDRGGSTSTSRPGAARWCGSTASWSGSIPRRTRSSPGTPRRSCTTPTLAAIIDHINHTRRKHIVTIEDPVEYIYEDRLSSIDQREVGGDTFSFQTALRQVLRQDPDVILIGEMRDKESVRTALSAAETGHLVLATLHTVDAPETINRLLDFFPEGEQQQARALIAGTLKGIVSQRLVTTADGKGRVAIAEVLTMTNRVHEMIIDPRATAQLTDAIKGGEYYGMQTFDQAFYAAVKRSDVSMQEALRHATAPHDLKLLLNTEGTLRTSMADVPMQPR